MRVIVGLTVIAAFVCLPARAPAQPAALSVKEVFALTWPIG